jgi:membrane fusion protein, macrolide-specific efflux system
LKYYGRWRKILLYTVHSIFVIPNNGINDIMERVFTMILHIIYLKIGIRRDKMGIFKLRGLIAFSTAACIGLFSSCALLPKEEDVEVPVLVTPGKIEYKLVEVKRGTITQVVEDVGILVSRSQQNLYFSSGKGGNITSIKVKAGDSVKRGQVVAEINSGNLKNEVREQELLVEKANLELERLKNSEADSYALKGAELDVEIAKVRLEILKDELNRTRIYADISGRIVQMQNIKLGDFVEPFKTIAVIANPNDVQLELENGVKPEYRVGMKSALRFKSSSVSGTLVSIPEDNSKGKVIVALDKIPEGAQIGDSMISSINVFKKDDVLFLPKNAVKVFNNNYYVEYLKDGTKRIKYIQVGIETHSEYEILDGLEVGEQVIAE